MNYRHAKVFGLARNAQQVFERLDDAAIARIGASDCLSSLPLLMYK